MVGLTFWQKQKEKILIELEMIINNEQVNEKLNNINKYFARQIKPKDFMSEVSDEVRHEKAFELNCILLSEYTNKSVREMSTKEYFTLLGYRNEQIRKHHGRQSNKTR